MALQTDISKKVFGDMTTFQGAYFKVMRLVQFSKEHGCSFDVDVYKNKEASTDPANRIEAIGVHFPYNDKCEAPILKECYEHMKTMHEFQDAKDV